jgi:hypothetical protein
MLNKTMKNGLQNTSGAIGHHDTQRKAGSCFFTIITTTQVQVAARKRGLHIGA